MGGRAGVWSSARSLSGQKERGQGCTVCGCWFRKHRLHIWSRYQGGRPFPCGLLPWAAHLCAEILASLQPVTYLGRVSKSQNGSLSLTGLRVRRGAGVAGGVGRAGRRCPATVPGEGNSAEVHQGREAWRAWSGGPQGPGAAHTALGQGLWRRAGLSGRWRSLPPCEVAGTPGSGRAGRALGPAVSWGEGTSRGQPQAMAVQPRAVECAVGFAGGTGTVLPGEQGGGSLGEGGALSWHSRSRRWPQHPA